MPNNIGRKTLSVSLHHKVTATNRTFHIRLEKDLRGTDLILATKQANFNIVATYKKKFMKKSL
jgi:hypothetical protein